MAYIPCTSNCRYQQEGMCFLEHATSSGITSDSGCIHYVPKKQNEYSKKEVKKNQNGHQN